MDDDGEKAWLMDTVIRLMHILIVYTNILKHAILMRKRRNEMKRKKTERHKTK